MTDARMVIAVVVALVVLLVLVPARAELPSQELIAAVGQHESGGKDNAVGDKKKKPSKRAYGYLQIRQTCLIDVNRRHGTAFKSVDMLGNRALSVWVFQRYMEMYATEDRLGRKPTNEDMARIWNGGPGGYKKAITLCYWHKVKKYLPPSQ